MLLSGLYRGSYLLSHAMSTGFVDERKNAIVRQNPANETHVQEQTKFICNKENSTRALLLSMLSAVANMSDVMPGTATEASSLSARQS